MAGLRISLVTVGLNSAATIERAMRSVLDQPGEPAEYVVIDGGSTDGSQALIARYTDRLSGWVSEPDRGQSHALNKGFSRVTGDIVGWLNADDELATSALEAVREAFARTGCDVLCGACVYRFADGRQEVRRVRPPDLDLLHVDDPIHQPSCFWRRTWHQRVGGLDERLHYGMDWDLWLRLKAAGARFATTDRVLSSYHVTGLNKTSVGGERRNREVYELLCRYNLGHRRLLTECAYRLLWPMKRMRSRPPGWLYRPISDALRSTALLALGPLYGFAPVRRCTHPFT